MQKFEAYGDLKSQFEATLHSGPWTPTGDKTIDVNERSTWPMVRFNALARMVFGGGLAALFKWPLGLIQASAATALATGALMGAVLCTRVGLW